MSAGRQNQPNSTGAIQRISPISIVTVSWIISIQNTAEYNLMSVSDVKFTFRRKLVEYVNRHLPMPNRKSHQINAMFSSLDRVAIELLAQGLQKKHYQRPEFLLPQVQLAIEPHSQVLATTHSPDFLARLF
jgi:hypothetical protein